MRPFPLKKMVCMVAAFFVATAVMSTAQSFSTLFTFDGNNGFSPQSLVQGTNGNFYGVTFGGGGEPGDGGTVFEMTSTGEMPLRYRFCSLANCADGVHPGGALTQLANGSFVGITSQGGSGASCNQLDGCGTLFEITTAGKLTTLYNFCSQANCADGYDPYGAVLDVDGNFYGAALGGTNSSGLIYKITPSGEFSVLYSFCSQTNCADGSGPSGLVLGSNGNFFGGTNLFGKNGSGTLFEITPSGQLTTLYNFTGVNGDASGAFSLQARNGNFYGTTLNLNNAVGEIFELTKAGKFVILYTFCSFNCGTQLFIPGGLLQASDGNFYGKTGEGGANLNGGVFKMTPAGKVTTFVSFPSCNTESSCPSGFGPNGLVQGTDGNFYGVMDAGGLLNCHGDAGCGTFFKVTTGLPSFVALNPNYGTVGSSVNILGNGLTGTTSVTFDGTPSTFTVVSDTYIRATVPNGTTGTIEVTTPSGTLSSNLAFQVVP
jgi:uncharacterized repeat protein (TIGR03803 family)